MRNENNQFTEDDWICAIVYITVVFWPFVLAILLMAMCPLFAIMFGEPEALIGFLPLAFLFFVIWGYRKALRDTAEIAEKNQKKHTTKCYLYE